MRVTQENTVVRVTQELEEQVIKVFVEQHVVKATKSDEVVLATINQGGTDKNYVHEQQVATNHWTIVHNLGKYPNVTILDDQQKEIMASVTYTSVNQIDIYFSANISGQVVLN